MFPPSPPAAFCGAFTTIEPFCAVRSISPPRPMSPAETSSVPVAVRVVQGEQGDVAAVARARGRIGLDAATELHVATERFDVDGAGADPGADVDETVVLYRGVGIQVDGDVACDLIRAGQDDGAAVEEEASRVDHHVRGLCAGEGERLPLLDHQLARAQVELQPGRRHRDRTIGGDGAVTGAEENQEDRWNSAPADTSRRLRLFLP